MTGLSQPSTLTPRLSCDNLYNLYAEPRQISLNYCKPLSPIWRPVHRQARVARLAHVSSESVVHSKQRRRSPRKSADNVRQERRSVTTTRSHNRGGNDVRPNDPAAQKNCRYFSWTVSGIILWTVDRPLNLVRKTGFSYRHKRRDFITV